jgi:hypothetical protein
MPRVRSVLAGGFVLLFAASFAEAVCDLDQAQTSWNSSSGGDRWQSFTAGADGFLCRIEINCFNPQAGSVLRVYAGGGTLGALLHTQNVDLVADVSTIDLDAPVAVSSGAVYTIRFQDANAWRLMTGNPYAGGQGSINPDVDYWFRTYVGDAPIAVDETGWGSVKKLFR